MKVVDEKIVNHRTLTIELDEVVLQALANFIGPTSYDDRRTKWKMKEKENNSLSDLYDLLYEKGIEANNHAYLFD